jgi:acetate kinase
VSGWSFNLPPWHHQVEVKAESMNSILTINGGSSSIKFALYQTDEPLKRRLFGKIDRIGLSGTNLTFQNSGGKPSCSRKLIIADHKSAADFLVGWLERQDGFESVQAVRHRVVHGMKHTEPEIVTRDLLEELHRIGPFDPDHLPSEIELIETFRRRHPKMLQVACFDTAFHQTMPRAAKLLPIPAWASGICEQKTGTRGFNWRASLNNLPGLATILRRVRPLA